MSKNINEARKSLRLPGYDYSRDGAYFITVCVENHQCLFGEVKDGQVILNVYGQIVNDVWQGLPNYVPDIYLDEFVVMPNHFHGILFIEKLPESAKFYNSLDVDDVKDRRKMLLPKVLGRFKMLTAKKINEVRQSHRSFWQRNYYEEVIDSQAGYEQIREYIVNNPLKWELDDFYSPG